MVKIQAPHPRIHEGTHKIGGAVTRGDELEAFDGQLPGLDQIHGFMPPIIVGLETNFFKSVAPGITRVIGVINHGAVYSGLVFSKSQHSVRYEIENPVFRQPTRGFSLAVLGFMRQADDEGGVKNNLAIMTLIRGVEEFFNLYRRHRLARGSARLRIKGLYAVLQAAASGLDHQIQSLGEFNVKIGSSV